MRVAVLMSCFNGETYIRQQIESILNQQRNFTLELWVRDDSSTDGTKAILQEYANKGKLHWYQGENKGPAYSFLDVLNTARDYDYYAFADQDDFWYLNKLESAIQILRESQTGIEPLLYFCNAELVGESLQPLGRMVYQQTPKTDFYTLVCAGGCLGCTMVFNKSLAQKIWRKEKPDAIVMHDFYLSVLCLALEGKLIYDSDCHMQYRQHASNVIGVSGSFSKTIQNRLQSISQHTEIGIAEQAKSILRLYGEEIQPEKREWLREIASYRNSFISRLRIAASSRTHYVNKNMSFTIRASILLGNR